MKERPKCPRCGGPHRGSWQVCLHCLDEVIFDGSTKKLYGRGYDLRPTRRAAHKMP